MALFIKLDANWVNHHKLIRAGLDGRGLHATAMCLAKLMETDGWIHRTLLYREGASDDLIDRLVDLRLLEVDGDSVRPWGWHDRNPSQAAIDATRTAKAEAAKAGNHKRWGHPGDVADCPKCTPNVQVSRTSDPTGSQPVALPSPEPEPEPEPDPSSSQTQFTTQPPTDDEQQPPDQRPDPDRHAAIVDQIVDLRLARRPDTATEIRDLARWRRSVAEAVRTDHGEAIWHQLHTDATASDQAIADRLEPAEHATIPLDESRHPAVVAQQRADATREPDGPPASPEAVRRLKAEALSGLASTRTLAAVPDPEDTP